MKLKKVMLVSSGSCEEVQGCLLAAGCEVTRVDDGEAAVFQAKKMDFDSAVVVSTGKGMDLAETVFNLRDISRAIPIIIVTGFGGNRRGVITEKEVARSVTNTRAFSLKKLKLFLWSNRTTGTRRARG